MKRISIVILFTLFALSVAAKNLESGYYRVSNVGSGRYAYITDNTGSIMYEAATADMGALELWKDHSRTFSDPASVIYAEFISSGSNQGQYDLRAQGVGVHELIGFYVTVYNKSGYYQVYGQGKYLTDSNSGSSDKGTFGTKGSGNYRNWKVSPVNTTDEYFGIKPTVSVQDRYFHPFYADFGFRLVGEGMKVWLVKDVNENAVIIAPFEGETVPAQTPVIIECSNSRAVDNKLDLVYDYSDLGQTNLLAGVFFNNDHRPKSVDARTVFDKNTMRVLGVTADGNLGYVLSTVAADSKGKQYLEANQSYLPVESDLPAEIPVMTESEYEEWIASSVPASVMEEDEVNVYMLSGRNLGKVSKDEINSLPAGIYIIGRKKVVID